MAPRREGYEALPDEGVGTAAPLPPIARLPNSIVPLARGQSNATSESGKLVGTAAGSTYTVTATAPQAQQASFQPGVPASSAQGSLEDAPSAIAAWEDATNLVTIWLGMALGTVILSFLEFGLGTLAGICGVVGSAKHLSRSCNGGDVAGAIRATHVMALVSTALSTIVCVMMMSLMAATSKQCNGEEYCAQSVEAFFFYMLWFGLYAGLSLLVARTASHLRLLLNPVTNGMVVV